MSPIAVIPSYAKEGDAGLDLTAIDKSFDCNGNIVYNTGLSIEIPEGYVGLLFPRSSVSKVDLSLSNSVGLIDSGYRGEIILKFKPTAMFAEDREEELNETFLNTDSYDYVTLANQEYEQRIYSVGERVGQLVIIPIPYITLEEVEDLSQTKRAEGGFGSTGI